MVKLQESLLGAPASRADECAPVAIACPHLPPDRSWHATTAGLGRRRRSGPSHTAQFPSFEIRDQQRQRAIEDCCGISSGNDVS